MNGAWFGFGMTILSVSFRYTDLMDAMKNENLGSLMRATCIGWLLLCSALYKTLFEFDVLSFIVLLW